MRKKKIVEERNSNFELLRIMAMIMIVAHHFSVHGGFSFDTNISINKAFIQFLSLGGKIGVDIFVLISGYFLITSDRLKLKKIIKLWCQIFFYSAAIYLVFTLFGHRDFKIFAFVKACLPIIYNKYWFVTAYFLLYLYTPYINKFLSKLDKNSYKKLLLTMFLCWSFIPTITKQGLYVNELIWFFFLYFVAGYVRLHYKKDNINSKRYLLYASGLYFITFFITILLDIFSFHWIKLGSYTTYLYGMEKLPIFFISLFLLLGFKNLKLKNNKKINFIASASFGVYLIHDNEFVRGFLWKTIFKNSSYAASTTLIPYAIFVIGIVYIGCTIVELIRIYLLEKPFMKWIDKYEEKIENGKKIVLQKLRLE